MSTSKFIGLNVRANGLFYLECWEDFRQKIALGLTDPKALKIISSCNQLPRIVLDLKFNETQAVEWTDLR